MAFIAQIRGKRREGRSGGCARSGVDDGERGGGREAEPLFFIKAELNELNWGNAWI